MIQIQVALILGSAVHVGRQLHFNDEHLWQVEIRIDQNNSKQESKQSISHASPSSPTTQVSLMLLTGTVQATWHRF